MRRFAAALVLFTLVAGFSSFLVGSRPRMAAAQPPPDRPGPGPPSGPSPRQWALLNQDSLAADRDSMMKVELDRIAGRENSPAESVFKNIKVMRGVPAEHLLRAMNAGFSRNLGVGCRFCHIPGHWADDDKSNKQVARDMMLMSRAINDTLLPRVSNPKNDQRVVNCGTCHHGHPNPNWEMMRARPGGPEPGH